MKRVAVMSKKKSKDVPAFDLSETVSNETSSVCALLTGLLKSVRGCQRTFEINGRRFRVDVDVSGTAKTTELSQRRR